MFNVLTDRSAQVPKIQIIELNYHVSAKAHEFLELTQYGNWNGEFLSFFLSPKRKVTEIPYYES